MVPLRQGDYVFRRQSIPELRQKLGISQAQMAERLGVPKNTVSRWERENEPTTPDADFLAAIYSLGKEKGITPEFFAPRKQRAAPIKQEPAQVRDYAIVYWDFASVTPANTYYVEAQASGVDLCDRFIRNEARKRAPKATRYLFKAFSHTRHATMTDRLSDWRIWEDDVDWTDRISKDVHSDTGQNPQASVVFLATANTNFVSLIRGLRSMHVMVYLVAPAGVSTQLVEAVGKRRWIRMPQR